VIFGFAHHKLLQTGQALLELLLSRRVFADAADELHSVESSLVVLVRQQFDYFVQLVQVVDLNFTFFLLGQGSQSSSRSRSHRRNGV